MTGKIAQQWSGNRSSHSHCNADGMTLFTAQRRRPGTQPRPSAVARTHLRGHRDALRALAKRFRASYPRPRSVSHFASSSCTMVGTMQIFANRLTTQPRKNTGEATNRRRRPGFRSLSPPEEDLYRPNTGFTSAKPNRFQVGRDSCGSGGWRCPSACTASCNAMPISRAPPCGLATARLPARRHAGVGARPKVPRSACGAAGCESQIDV